MDAESSIKSSKLEITFRKHVKQYRALLRWGVDKVFHDSRIDALFHDVKQSLDTGNARDATTLLADLKKEIDSLETQYPIQKNEIEKKLYARIEQLETIIGKKLNIDLDDIQDYFKMLEIARVALQNDDWAEAKNKIERVENNVLDFGTTEDTSSLGPIAESLRTAREKTMIGRLLNPHDLKKTFDTLDQSNIENIRIGFIAAPETINTELAHFSKRPITIKKSSTQVLLLRMSISRDLSIYLIGIPIHADYQISQLDHIVPHLSSAFINMQNIEDDCVDDLIKSIATLSSGLSSDKNKLFINKQSDAEQPLFNDLTYTEIKNNETHFTEEAAFYLAKYSDLR